ncbi:hypothetical protein JKP88DRAFT_321364 [Tribonema minus]|uniref:Sulfatase N-terminal domain-containing protein n=1 Tax=Tribonema minus TaxID=303371 RepID=A0A835YVH5_9STRA|nr:hypothetical protein JKP88DRAFT_321364 [Tribonema minus]
MASARGYDRFFGYLGGGNDHWTYKINKLSKGSCGRPSLDLWHNGAPATDKVPHHTCGVASQDGCWYEDALFEQQVTGAINDHADLNTTQPLFLTWAPHAVHVPLQPIAAQEAKFDFIDFPSRRKRIGRVVSTLKRRGLWDTTLLVKGFNSEGGVRSNAFMAGGFVPEAQRGSVANGLMGIEDFYATSAGGGGDVARDLVVVSDGHQPQAVIDRLGYKLIVGETSSKVFQQIEPVQSSESQKQCWPAD